MLEYQQHVDHHQPFEVSVVYEYTADEAGYLSLTPGDVILVTDPDPSGWWEGVHSITGERGLFPANYTNREEELSTSSVSAGNGGAAASVVEMKRLEVKKEPLVVVKEERNETITRYAFYAKNWSRLNSVSLVIVGIIALFTVREAEEMDVKVFSMFDLVVFIYGIVFAATAFIVESVTNSRGIGKFSWRTLVYVIAAVPLLSSVVTLFNGVVYLITAVLFYVSSKKKEVFNAPKGESAQLPHIKCPSACCVCDYYRGKIKEGKCGKETFTYLFIAALISVWFYGYLSFKPLVEPGGPLAAFTKFLPRAKGFGYGLDLLCAAIVLPVCRTFIRKLYDFSTQDHTTSSRMLRRILWLFPLDKALHFHEKVGWLILIFAWGHSMSHLMNASLRFSKVLEVFGWTPLITGFLLWICIFFMFPAVLKNVKTGHFEIFWYSHQMFWMFFGLNLIHGRNGWGPNFWKWFVGPGLIYVAERIYRAYSAYQTVTILSITNMKGNVLSIEFSKSAFPNGYKEGQYCYINCPSISKGQWHPFTISSAPGDPTVTLHIKILGKNSWTRQVADYFSFMGPRNSSYFEMADSGPSGIEIGKTRGPLGERMLMVYGPHSAPTQHCPEYCVDMIVGSGIGVTPVSATMQQIVFYRWKFSIGDSSPDHAYFVWVCNYSEMESFRWMIRTVKECQDEVFHLRAISPQAMRAKTFEVHIYVTSVPENNEDALKFVIDDDVAFWGRPRKATRGIEKAPQKYSEEDIYRAMLNPPKNSNAQLGDIRVYNGRPKWEKLFDRLANRHPSSNIGVAFCGNPRISEDLKAMCRKYTNPALNQRFVLHKENF